MVAPANGGVGGSRDACDLLGPYALQVRQDHDGLVLGGQLVEDPCDTLLELLTFERAGSVVGARYVAHAVERDATSFGVLAQLVDAEVHDDLIEPGEEFLLGVEPSQRAVHANECFLSRVLGKLKVANDGIGIAASHILKTPDDLSKRPMLLSNIATARGSSGNQGFDFRHINSMKRCRR